MIRLSVSFRILGSYLLVLLHRTMQHSFIYMVAWESPICCV